MDRKTRRSVLITGAGTLAALAGCSGSSDDGSSGSSETTTSEQPTTLDINNAVLCSEKPTGYREYTEQPNSTYDPGEVIWVYFEPSTTGTESTGEGEIRFEYDFTVSVTGPNGENLGSVEDTAGRTVSEGTDLQKVFLFANYSPPTEFEGGTHTLEVEVTDTIADNTATETLEFEVDSGLAHASGEFGIGRFVFTESEARGYRDYDENAQAEYGTTEKVWYYYEIDGFAYEETENAKTPDLQITETLTGPEGDIWSEANIPLSNMFEPSKDLDEYFITDYIAPSQEWLPGEYELRFEITDGYTDKRVTEEYTFTVVE
ncbi:hypothetical protein [Halodesulfurarchaeum sp.]|uniref:hypothetical protein n=1 Tax=Halodesulfurarchaeum sp. TaxID=1980530 RepID=UPI002FC30AB8